VALSHALAGNVARAQELMARVQNPPPAVAGKAAEIQPNPAVVELRDFYRVWQTAHDGDLAGARALFLARSQWIYPDAVVRAGIVRLLRQGASPGEMTGGLAQEPDAIIAEYRAQRRDAVLNNRNVADRLFTLLGQVPRQEDFNAFARDVWLMDHSRIIDFPLGDDGAYRTYSTGRLGGGTPAGYALLLHVALLARNQGRHEFTLFPSRAALTQLSVRFGDSGGEGMFAGLTFQTDRVIADLTPIIPQPAAR
jgi:hypothetical protein